MSDVDTPQVIYPEGFDGRAAMEMGFKGWISVRVAVPGGAVYELMFVDSVRLAQDVEAMDADARPCYAEPGLVLVCKVTPEAVEASVLWLWQTGYFERLQPAKT